MAIEPTTRARIYALDVLRGFAILGILIANMPSFGGLDWFGATAVSEQPPGDQWAGLLSLVFVQGKFRSMLAVLFGVGVWLQYQKRSSIEGNWPGGYVKRSLWLGAFGLFHGLFIWFGDILFLYAGMAIITCLLVGLDKNILKAIIGGFGFLAVVIGLGMAGVIVALGGMSGGGEFGMLDSESITRAFQQGTYIEQLQIRAFMFAMVTAFFSVIGLAMLPLFLVGVLFGRSGVLQNPSQHPVTRKAALAVGFGIGLPLNLVAIAFHGSDALTGFEIFAEFVSGPLLAFGYLMAVAIAVEKAWLPRILGAVSKVGRLALTSYLSQSLICTFIFYSWGLALFGKLSVAQMMAVVPVVWAINLVFAHLWLKQFSIGPFEWLWRSLTEGSRLPMRRVNETAPDLA